MEARNCPKCGRVFAMIRESICPKCVKEAEATFEKVRDFIKENPNMTIKEVAEECDVSYKRILTYIRDGRVEASGGMHGEVTCSRCDKPIKVGRMCEKCTIETGFKVNEMKEDARIKNRGQMRATTMRKNQ